MAENVVIYDSVAYTTGSAKDNDLVVHTLSRGDEVPSDVSKETLERWLDPEVSPPYGAVAPKGSELAKLGATGASVAMDPAEARRLFHEAAGAERILLDPARDPVDEEKANVDRGVRDARRRAGDSAGTAEVAPASGAAANLDLDGMNKSQLKAMAEGLGVEHESSDTANDLRDKIRSHMSGEPPAAEQE